MDKWLSNNTFVKIVALAIGILLWVVVHMDSQPAAGSASSSLKEDKIYNVAVTPRYDTSQYTIRSIEPSEVTVVLQWKETVLRRVSTGNVQVEADLGSYKEGTHIVTLRAVGVPGSVTADILPQTVRVVIEKKETKQVPVVVNVTGTPHDGYKTGQPVVKPARVQVTMPQSRLDEADSARAEISVDKETSTVSKQVKLTVYDKNGKPVEGASVTPQVVDVEVPVTSPFKQMPLQIKLNGEPAVGFSVASVVQKPEQVTVYAPQDILNKMDFYEGLTYDLNGMKESKTVNLDVPVGRGATQVDPVKVTLQIEVVPSATRLFEKVPITLLGQNKDYTAALAAPAGGTVDVQLEGSPDLLNKLRPQDVQAVIDVSNLAPGRHEEPVNLNLPPFIKKPAQPLLAQVDITAKPGASPAAGASTQPSAAPSAAVSASPTPAASLAPSAPAAPASGGASASPAVPAAGASASPAAGAP